MSKSNRALQDNESSIEQKAFWGGASTATAISCLTRTSLEGPLRLAWQNLNFAPSALLMLQELLINVLDQEVRSGVQALHVNYKIETLAGADGPIGSAVFEVLNFGPGFSVVKHDALDEWEPYIMSMHLHNGTSFSTEATPNSVTGGTNGVGLKIARRFSLESELVTIDPATKRVYAHKAQHLGTRWIEQRSNESIAKLSAYSRERMPFKDIYEHAIELTTQQPAPYQTLAGPLPISATRPFTLIRLRPRFHDRFGMNAGQIGQLIKALEGTLYQLAVLLNAPVFLNKTRLDLGATDVLGRLKHFVGLIHGADTPVAAFTLDPEEMGDIRQMTPAARQAIYQQQQLRHFPLHVVIAMRKDCGGADNWACINGVNVTVASCQLFKHLSEQITKLFAARGHSESGDAVQGESNLATVSLSFYVAGFMPRPTWASQSKNGSTFTMPAKFFEPYIVPKTALDKLVAHAGKMFEVLRNKQRIEEVTEILKTSKERPIVRKWTPCKLMNAKTWEERSRAVLFIDEGDSAHKLIMAGTRSAACPMELGTDVAAYPFQGVPKNVRDSFIIDDSRKLVGRDVRIPDPALARNDIWSDFVKIIGLDYYKTYETDAEVAILNFGKLVIATDQDVDGEGKITSLILNFFDVFWPALIRRGFIYRFVTPLVRVFQTRPGRPPKLVSAFTTEPAFRAWAHKERYYKLLNDDLFALAAGDPARHKQLVRDAVDCRNLRVEYYKGLGGHGTLGPALFSGSAFYAALMRFDYDEGAPALFKAFFDSDSEPRKILLRGNDEAAPEPLRTQIATALSSKPGTASFGSVANCGQHLLSAYREYCISDLERKLNSVIDGMNDVNRRVLCGAMQYFSGKKRNAIEKVATVFGPIAERAHYHHEPALIAEVISRNAQTFFGSNRLPIFIGYGDFGNRDDPRPAEARYISVGLNHAVVDNLYPPSDLTLLPYRFEDGKRSVPVHFVPTIPPLFESFFLPSTGWQVNTQAIDVGALMSTTAKLIAGEIKVVGGESGPRLDGPVPQFKLDTRGWNGVILEIPADEHRPASFVSIGRCRVTKRGGDIDICVHELPLGVTGVQYYEYLKKLGSVDEWVEGKQKKVRTFITHPFISNFKSGTGIIPSSSGEPGSPNEIDINFTISAEAFARLQTTTYRGYALGQHALAAGLGLIEPINRQLNYWLGGRAPHNPPSGQTTNSLQGRVLELSDYSEVIAHWYPERERLYRARIERELILAVFQRALILETQHAFDVDVPKLIKGRGIAEQDVIFAQQKFFPFNPRYITHPGYISNETLPQLISGFATLAEFEAAFAAGLAPTAMAIEGETDGDDADDDAVVMKPPTYEYIRRLQLGQSAASESRRKKVAELDARIAELRAPDCWKTTWLRELGALKAVCAEHMPTFWRKLTAVEV